LHRKNPQGVKLLLSDVYIGVKPNQCKYSDCLKLSFSVYFALKIIGKS